MRTGQKEQVTMLANITSMPSTVRSTATAAVSMPPFRGVLEAMGLPGRMFPVEPPPPAPMPLNPASTAVFLTFLDEETTLWTDLTPSAAVLDWFAAACGCPLVTEPCLARFALVTDARQMPALRDFMIRGEVVPSGSSVVVVQVDGAHLRSRIHPAEAIPGIGRIAAVTDAAEGVTVILTAGSRLKVLPSAGAATPLLPVRQ
jgi:phosphonate C-P lyase system protein PhnH